MRISSRINAKQVFDLGHGDLYWNMAIQLALALLVGF
jgi:hypothetical protein